MDLVTKEDLQIFRMQILDDIKSILVDVKAVVPKQEWLKSGEVRKQLKVSPGTLQNLRIAGKLNPVKIKGTWYYNSEEINALFNQERRM